LPDFQKNDQARNKYYLIPFLLGLLGMFFHYQRRPRDFAAIIGAVYHHGYRYYRVFQPAAQRAARTRLRTGRFVLYLCDLGRHECAGLYDLLSKRP
jgi:hypothetical protein